MKTRIVFIMVTNLVTRLSSDIENAKSAGVPLSFSFLTNFIFDLYDASIQQCSSYSLFGCMLWFAL